MKGISEHLAMLVIFWGTGRPIGSGWDSTDPRIVPDVQRLPLLVDD